MKKNKTHYLIISYFTLLSSIFISCNDQEEIEKEYIDGILSLETNKITLLDDNYDISFDLDNKNNIKFNTIQILNKNRESIANAVISGNKATFSSSTLTPLKLGDIKIKTSSKLSDNKETIQNFSIKVNKSADIISSSKTFKDQSSKKFYISMINKSLSSKNALESLEWKKGSNGTYAKEGDATFTDKSDTLKLLNKSIFSKYSLKESDTLYFRYTLENNIGTKDIDSINVVIIPQLIGGKSKDIIFGNNDTKLFNFLTSKAEKKPEDNEVKYVGSKSIEVVSPSTMKFVKLSLTEEELNKAYAKGDLLKAKSDFDSGSPITKLTFGTKVEVYSYEIERTDKKGKKTTYNGYLKLKSLVDIDTNDERIIMEYKEGIIE